MYKSIILAALAPLIALGQFPIVQGILDPNGVAIISYCSTPGYPSSPKSTNLAGWWPAKNALCSGVACSNGGSVTTVTDGSGNSNTMTVAGGTVTYNASGLNGQPTLSFDANAYMTMASQIGGANAYTSYVVFNIPTIAGGQSYAFFATDSFAQYEYRIAGASPGQQQILAEGSGLGASGTSSTVTQNTWYQANSIYSGSSGSNTYAFRLNRTANGSGTPTGGVNVNGPNTFGRNRVNNGENFRGTYADSFIYTELNIASTVTYNECYIYGKDAL